MAVAERAETQDELPYPETTCIYDLFIVSSKYDAYFFKVPLKAFCFSDRTGKSYGTYILSSRSVESRNSLFL